MIFDEKVYRIGKKRGIWMKQKLRQLAIKKIDQMMQASGSQIDVESVPIIDEFFTLYIEESQLLQRIYHAYRRGLLSLDLHHQQAVITYKRKDDTQIIIFSNKQFALTEAFFVQLLTFAIEITREVLPLGTVVELNPTYFKPDHQAKEPSKVVITERFVAPAGYNSYFPYGGIIYPIGEMKKGAKVHFTDPLIHKIIHRGYQDEVEDAFVLLMKEELIVDNNIYSIEFSTDDMQRIEKDMGQEVGEK